MNRPQRPGKTPANTGHRATIGFGGGGGLANGGGVEAVEPGDVDPNDASFDANTQTRFQPSSGFLNFLSGGKASAQANQLNANSVLQDQASRNALSNRVAEINATHAATQADQEREEGDLGRNWASYASAHNLSLPPGSAPLSAQGLGNLYGSTYGARTPFIEGFNKEKVLGNQNTNLDLTNEAQNTPEYADKYKAHVMDSLQAAVNDALLSGTKSRFELNKFAQNSPADLATSGVESNINLGRANNTLNNLPAENIANLSTLKARPYLNAAAVLAGQEGPKFGNYSINYDLSKGGAPMLYKFPSERETLSAPLTGKTPGVTVEPFNPGSGVNITNPETGKTVNLKRSVSNPAVDSILSPVTALQRAREPFNGVTAPSNSDDTTLADETQRNPVNTGSPLTNPYTLAEDLGNQQVEQSQPSSKVPVKTTTGGISPLSWTEWPGYLKSEYTRVLKALKQNSRSQ